LKTYHPFDWNSGGRGFDKITLGIVCSSDYEQKILNFLASFGISIPSKWKQNKVWYVPFETTFQCELDYTSTKITNPTFSLTGNVPEDYTIVEQQYRSAIRSLKGKADVILVHVPPQLDPYHNAKGRDLHSIIKKIGIQERVLTQVFTAHSLENPLQDMSDTMWNLSVAIYSKAGGIPWTLEESLPVSTAYVGIAFNIKRVPPGQLVLTGIAQLYNRYGIHVESFVIDCVQPGNDFIIDRDKIDSFQTSYHLSKTKAKTLIDGCLTKYRAQYGENPRNIVVHKTSYFKEEEQQGIKLAATDSEIDFIHLVSESKHLVFRDQADSKRGYPVDKGSFWPIDDSRAVVYTAGYVDSLETYPGAGSPTPIEIRSYGGKTSLARIAEQSLALAKMDWNTCKLIVQEPVTIVYARRVGDVLKEGLESTEVTDETRYYR